MIQIMTVKRLFQFSINKKEKVCHNECDFILHCMCGVYDVSWVFNTNLIIIS